MAEKKQIQVKVKKRKLKVKRIILLFVIIAIIVLSIYFIKKIPIQNIYILNNTIISDKEIIETAGLTNYPSFIDTSSKSIKDKLLKNNYIKKVKVEKKLLFKVYITIEEQKVLASYNKKILLEDGNYVDNIYNINSVPIINNDVSAINDRFVKKFKLINNDILLKISEINYIPNEVDKERFSLKMNDGNLVYITLSKIKKINKYNSIYSELEGRKGIIYLDSGDYVELKEDNNKTNEENEEE